jgi:hypothetical protein
MKCDNCDRAFDTDYHPGAFLADGVVVLCDGCITEPDKVLKALKHGLKTAEVAHKRYERTDNQYASSGRMDRALADIRSLKDNIKQVQEDFEKWLGNQ